MLHVLHLSISKRPSWLQSTFWRLESESFYFHSCLSICHLNKKKTFGPNVNKNIGIKKVKLLLWGHYAAFVCCLQALFALGPEQHTIPAFLGNETCRTTLNKHKQNVGKAATPLVREFVQFGKTVNCELILCRYRSPYRAKSITVY